MARPRRTTARSVKDELFQYPYRFQFFQAVRLLRILRLRRGQRLEAGDVGGDYPPDQEPVRLRGSLGHRFPAAEIAELSPRGPDERVELSVNVMGLYGAMGVLPLHDSQRLIDSRRDSSCETAFLYLFNHRMISLFYRAWAKHSLPLNYEQSFGRFTESSSGSAVADRSHVDDITTSLLSLAGVGLPGLRERLDIPDAALAFFAGHFSCQPKSASALSQMIRTLFGVPVKIAEFVGQWLQLDEANRSEMATPERVHGQNCQLGRGFVLGMRSWDVVSKFRIILGPLTYQQMLAFSPLGDQLKRLGQLTRTYVGVQLDFDVQLELLAEEIPRCTLSGGFSLGVNGWLYSRDPTENVSDAVFQPQI